MLITSYRCFKVRPSLGARNVSEYTPDMAPSGLELRFAIQKEILYVHTY
jgi:hypothetical protein